MSADHTTAPPSPGSGIPGPGGIDEAMIERLVRAFYARAREDELLGPVFASRIVEWEPHLDEIGAFWSSLVLKSGRYHGRPMARHLSLAIDSRHFDRWLQLFEQTAREQCPPDAAGHFVVLARRIGQSFELGIAGARGKLLRMGERLPAL